MADFMEKVHGLYAAIQMIIPIAFWITFSTRAMVSGLTVPEKGPRTRKDLSRVVICSQLAKDNLERPPTPLANFPFSGLDRKVVEMVTTVRSLARRFRM